MNKDHLKIKFDQERMDQPAPEGHQARFMKKLTKVKAEPNQRSIPLWGIGIAAASVIALLSIFTIEQMKEDALMTERIELHQLNPTAAQSQQDLLQKVLLKSSKIDIHAPELKEELDALRRLENEYQMLDSLFQRSIVNEQLLQALITNYGHRLKVLEQMSHKLQYLKQLNQSKAIEHEKV